MKSKTKSTSPSLGSITSSWGTATIAVVLGQLYVGYGYRILYGSMLELMNKVDGVLLHKDDTPYGDML